MPQEPGARRENRPLAAERAVLCPARLSVRRCALPSPVSLQAEGPADSGHKDLPKGLTHRSPRPHAPRSLVTPASRDRLLVHSPVLLQSVSEKLEKKRGLVTHRFPCHAWAAPPSSTSCPRSPKSVSNDEL